MTDFLPRTQSGKLHCLQTGFPPIRENRENFEDFPVREIKEKQGGLSQNQGKKFKSGNFFQNYFQTI